VRAVALLVTLLLAPPGLSQTVVTYSTSGGGGTLADPANTPSYPGTLPAGSGLASSVSVPNHVTQVDSVVLTSIAHGRTADVHAILRDPTGKGTSLFVRPGYSGVVIAGSFEGGGSTLTVVPSGGVGFPTLGGTIASGTYVQYFGCSLFCTWPDGQDNVFNTNLGAVTGPPGLWTLEILDWQAGFTG